MSWYEQLLRSERGVLFQGSFNRLRLAVVKALELRSRARAFWHPWCTSRRPFLGSSKRQSVFFIAIFSMLAKVAAADGRVARSEMALISSFIDEKLSLSEQQKNLALQTFKLARSSSVPFEYYARHYRELFCGNPVMMENAICLFLILSFADKEFSSEEEKLVLSAATIFGLSREEYLSLKKQYVSNSGDRGQSAAKKLEEAYRVLGCLVSDSTATCKKRYRELVKTLHPDILQAHGVSNQMLSRSNAEFRAVQEAYELILEARKRSLGAV